MVFLCYHVQKRNLIIFLLMQKLGLHIQKYFNALDVSSTSFLEKDPYPNKAFTISSEPKIKPKLAGIDNNKESSKDLL